MSNLFKKYFEVLDEATDHEHGFIFDYWLMIVGFSIMGVCVLGIIVIKILNYLGI